MGANIWFWLIYVITLLFGVWGMNPWRSCRCLLGSLWWLADPLYFDWHSRAARLWIAYTLGLLASAKTYLHG